MLPKRSIKNSKSLPRSRATVRLMSETAHFDTSPAVGTPDPPPQGQGSTRREQARGRRAMSQSIVGAPPPYYVEMNGPSHVVLSSRGSARTPSAAPARSLVWEADCSESCDSSAAALDWKSKGPESSGARSPLTYIAQAVGAASGEL